MFGINPGEFAVLLLVALIVVGPERLPKYAQQLGRMVREGRRMAMGLREQVRGELGPEFDDVDWTKLDPRQYDPRRIIREALTDTLDDEPAEPAPKAVSGGGPAATAATAAATTGAAAATTGAAARTSLTKEPAPGASSVSPAEKRPSSAASPMAAAAVGKPAPEAAPEPGGDAQAAPAAPASTSADSPAAPVAEQPPVPQARSAAGAAVDLEAT